MIACGHRVVPFAGEIVGVEWSGTAAGRAALLAFGPVAARDARLPEVVFRLGTRDDTGLVTLFRGRTCLYRGGSIGTGAHLLVQGALDQLIERSAAGLVLHAALLGRGDAGVLLPGPTGSGKTMLAAWLGRRGLAPLSDEACYLPDGQAAAESFARPFCFKGAWADVLGVDGVAQPVLADEGVSLVPRAVLAAAEGPPAIVPRLLVFPRYRAAAPLALTPLTPARAAVRLMESVANGRNLPDHGVGRVTALVRSAPAYGLSYGGFEQLDPLLELLASLS